MHLRPLSLLLACALPAFSQTPPPPLPPATPAPPSASPAGPTPPPAPSVANPQPAPGFVGDPYTFPKMTYEDPPQIQVDVLMVSVPQDQALPLLPQLRDPAKIEAAQTAILELVTHHQARLIDWPMTTAHQGVRVVSEAIVEQRYPIEFDQPTVPQTFGGAPAKEKTPAEKAVDVLQTLGIIVPTTFETRNTGATLEVEASASPDFKAVSMQIAAQSVELLGMQNFPAGKNEKGEPLTVPQPLFRTEKTTTTTTIESGKRRLIYVGNPAQPGGELIFFILGAKVIPPIASKAPAQK